MIPPLTDWYDPLRLAEEGDDCLGLLAPYYQAVVELVVPLVVGDVLTERAWKWAKEGLDRRPLPRDRVGWTTAWRNFLGDIWRLVAAHAGRERKAAQARGREAQGALALSARPPVLLEL